jgi:hypothetical protein
VCPRERLVIISYTIGLSFALERIGPLAAIVITVFYLLVLYLFALLNALENLFASIYSESLIKTTCQHLLLLVGFDTLIYRKYYDTPPILVGHQSHNKKMCGLPSTDWGVDIQTHHLSSNPRGRELRFYLYLRTRFSWDSCNLFWEPGFLFIQN